MAAVYDIDATVTIKSLAKDYLKYYGHIGTVSDLPGSGKLYEVKFSGGHSNKFPENALRITTDEDLNNHYALGAVLNTIDVSSWVGKDVVIIAGKMTGSHFKVMKSSNGWVQLRNREIGPDISKRPYELRQLFRLPGPTPIEGVVSVVAATDTDAPVAEGKSTSTATGSSATAGATGASLLSNESLNGDDTSNAGTPTVDSGRSTPVRSSNRGRGRWAKKDKKGSTAAKVARNQSSRSAAVAAMEDHNASESEAEVSVKREKGVAKGGKDVDSAAKSKEEEEEPKKELTEEEKKLLVLQKRARMIRAYNDHAERVKEHVARHQLRLYQEHRPNMSLFMDEFESDDEDEEIMMQLNKNALDLIPLRSCPECKAEIGELQNDEAQGICWNPKCKVSLLSMVNESDIVSSTILDLDPKNESRETDDSPELERPRSRRIAQQHSAITEAMKEPESNRLMVLECLAKVHVLGRTAIASRAETAKTTRSTSKDVIPGALTDSYLAYRWRMDEQGTGDESVKSESTSSVSTKKRSRDVDTKALNGGTGISDMDDGVVPPPTKKTKLDPSSSGTDETNEAVKVI